MARVVRTPERDVLFLERALDLLRPGGRLGIVLPYNKAAGSAFSALRRWLVDRARIFAVVGLPRETFHPHTSQRTFVLFAQAARRAASDRAAGERVMFVVSERAGKDAAGDPIARRDGGGARSRSRRRPRASSCRSSRRRASRREGRGAHASPSSRRTTCSRRSVTSSPRGAAASGDGVPLGELVVERRERIDPNADAQTRSCSTRRTRATASSTSQARCATARAARARRSERWPGDLVVSRLRPYLRQIALVHPSALALAGDRPLALSTEFYVLAPRSPGDDLAFLLPFLLSTEAQSRPRERARGRSSPARAAVVAVRAARAAEPPAQRAKTSRAVIEALAASYRASSQLRGAARRVTCGEPCARITAGGAARADRCWGRSTRARSRRRPRG